METKKLIILVLAGRFSTFQPHDLSNPVPLAVAPQNIKQGIQNSVQPSQVAPPNNSMTPQMVQSVSGQNPQGWSGGPPQNLQPNLVMNMAGLQQLAYNQWGRCSKHVATAGAAAAAASTANTIECQLGGNGSNTKHGMGCTKL
ncbi:hypothetical protein Tco_1180419, partial [Tanacetum coccineum]